MTIKRMNVAEFREFGYLQEVNRQFFHPLGLALEVLVDEETGNERLGGIWDYREDPEGVIFADGIDGNKAVAVRSELIKREKAREEMMGSTIQPIDWEPETTEIIDDSADNDA